MKLKELWHQLFHNLSANVYAQVITVAIQLASVPFFLHYWNVGLYGEWLILSAIPAYLSLTDIGFASVAANDMSMRVARGDFDGAKEVYQSIWLLITFMSILIGIGFILLSYCFSLASLFTFTYISSQKTIEILFVLILYVLSGLQLSVLMAAYRATGFYAYSIILSNSVRLVEWLTSIFVLVFNGDVLFVAISLLAIRLLGFLMLLIILKKNASWLYFGYAFVKIKIIKDLFKPAVAFISFPLGLAFNLQGVILLIGYFLGPSAVVIYSTYRTLTRLLVQASNILNQSIWPHISVAYGSEKLDVIRNYHRKISSINFWLVLISSIFILLFGNIFIGIWTNNTFELRFILLLIFLLLTIVTVFWQTSWVVLMATNKHHQLSVFFILSSIFGLLLSGLFMQFFGLNGAVLGLLIAETPLCYLAIKNALSLVHDSFFDYICNLVKSPFGWERS